MAPPSGASLAPQLDLPTPPQPQDQPQQIAQPVAPPPTPTRDQGFMGKGGKIADIASNFLNGWLTGRQRKADNELKKASSDAMAVKANVDTAWSNWTRVAQNPAIEGIQTKLAEQAKAAPNVQAALQKSLSGQALTPDEQKNLQDLQQHALNADEQQLLQNYNQSKMAFQGAAKSYSDMMGKYMQPEKKPGAGTRAKQAVGVGIQPEMFSGLALQGWNKLYPSLQPPGPSPQAKLEQAELNEFNANAPTRKTVAEATKRQAETDIAKEDAKAKFSKILSDTSKTKEQRDAAEEEFHKTMDTLSGKVQSPAEKLANQLGEIGSSALDKASKGTLETGGTQAEKDWFNKNMKDVPATPWDELARQVGTTTKDAKGNTRTFTWKDAIDQYSNMMVKERRADRPPTTAELDWANIRSDVKLAHPDWTPQQQSAEVLNRMKPSTDEKNEAKLKPLEEKEKIVIAMGSMAKAKSQFPDSDDFTKEVPDKDKEGKPILDKDDKPIPGFTHYVVRPDVSGPSFESKYTPFGKSADEETKAKQARKQEFVNAWAQEMKGRGADAETIKEYTGVDFAPQQQVATPPPGPAAQPGPPPSTAQAGPQASNVQPPPTNNQVTMKTYTIQTPQGTATRQLTDQQAGLLTQKGAKVTPVQ